MRARGARVGPLFPCAFTEFRCRSYAVYYVDNGASNWDVTANVCTTSPAAWAFFTTGARGGPRACACASWVRAGGANLPARNCHVDHLWYTSADVLAGNNECAAFNCTVDTATVFAVTGGWPAEAQAIIDAAGA